MPPQNHTDGRTIGKRVKKLRPRKIVAALIFLSMLTAAWIFLGSFQFSPDSSDDASFIDRAQHKSVPGIKVSASALSASESQRSFGENLAGDSIQPVWLSIENDTNDQLTFLPITMDPDYYSPYEVSYRFSGLLSFAANRARDAFFLKRQIASILPPQSVTTGFVYGVLDAGVKYAHIVIAGNGRLEAFDFALPVPGAAFVGANIRAGGIYRSKAVLDLELESLRTTLAGQPCCTTNADATRDGDPLNLVIIESDQQPIIPFAARGWHPVRTLDVMSAVETVRAFLFRDAFLTSPVSPLYVFGRQEDVALQKARLTINERVHARLWLTPYAFQGRKIWMGQVSRDIGVRLTDRTWNLTTHKIGPDVDFDRTYLLQDLLMSGFVERYGYVDGVGNAPATAPRRNLAGDPYYTDGLRAVIFLSNKQSPLEAIERLPWEAPPPPPDEAR
jgi:hypothetical protein